MQQRPVIVIMVGKKLFSTAIVAFVAVGLVSARVTREGVIAREHAVAPSSFVRKIPTGNQFAGPSWSTVPRGGYLSRGRVLVRRSPQDNRAAKEVDASNDATEIVRGGEQTEAVSLVVKAEKFLGLELRKVFNRDRRPWLICLGLSLAYWYVFANTKPIGNCFKDGFCVMGLTPDAPEKCAVVNSHTLAFSVNVVFTLLTFIFHTKTPTGEPYRDWIKTIGIAIIIGGHGFLHYWIGSTSPRCNPNQSDGELAYLPFAFFLNVLMVGPTFGFSNIPRNQAIVYIVLLTWFIFNKTLKYAKENKAISFFFLASQLITSLVSIFNPGPMVTPLIGWFFIAPIAVSLFEYLKCDWLEKIGGHMWYDITLHISILIALINFDNKNE